MLTDVPGMLTRAGLYPHSQPTAAVIHDKSVSLYLPPSLFKWNVTQCEMYINRLIVSEGKR